jgi:flagellar export protein FliJ
MKPTGRPKALSPWGLLGKLADQRLLQHQREMSRISSEIHNNEQKWKRFAALTAHYKQKLQAGNAEQRMADVQVVNTFIYNLGFLQRSVQARLDELFEQKEEVQQALRECHAEVEKFESLRERTEKAQREFLDKREQKEVDALGTALWNLKNNSHET